MELIYRYTGQNFKLANFWILGTKIQKIDQRQKENNLVYFGLDNTKAYVKTITQIKKISNDFRRAKTIQYLIGLKYKFY